MDLYSIKDPSFLKTLSIKELEELSKEIREFLIEKISKSGGHLSGNLGIVELTIALHRYFSNGEKFIFDVGHQCYTHKILTGRAKEFDCLRQKDGLSGFLSSKESDYDVWDVAHSSTSIAAQCGMLDAGIEAISIIGDGALTGGEAFESLSFLTTMKRNAICIINDNSFSISKNVGAIRHVLDSLRSSNEYIKISDRKRKSIRLKGLKNMIKGMFYKTSIFDDMGFKYYGPIDGHDFNELFKYFEYASRQNRPVILHVMTKKGKGYQPAEIDEVGKWHSVPPFDIKSGEFIKGRDDEISFNEALCDYLLSYYDKNKDLRITMPAMTYPSKLQRLKEAMGGNYIDTGIAEQFTISYAAALSTSGLKVVAPIYSSFLQRAYDQLQMDMAMQGKHVVIVSQNSGLVPSNGKTHQGIYDISYLKSIPNLKIYAPKDQEELSVIMDRALDIEKGPVAIHLPSTKTKKVQSSTNDTFNESWTLVNNIDSPRGFLITYSSNVDYIKEEMAEIGVEVVNARSINPIDMDMIRNIKSFQKPVFVLEDAPLETSFGSFLLSKINEENIELDITLFGLPLDFIDIGTVEELRRIHGIDKKSIREKVLQKI